jgi:adenylate cyclase
MTARSRLYFLICGLVPVVITTVLSLYRPSFVARYEYTTYDTVLRAATSPPEASRVVIVDLDERSLTTVGQWPWRRDVVGQLIAQLRKQGAAVIALDFIFAEADRFEGTSQSPSTDASFADTLREGRVVLGYAMTFDGPEHGKTACVQHPLGIPLIQRAGDAAAEPFFQATGAVCSLPALTMAAGASGYLNAAPDPDGVLRRAPLLMELNGQVYPALSLATVAAATRTRDIALSVANVNTSTLMFGSTSVPLDGKSNLLLRYRGKKRSFPYVSAADVLRGLADARLIADKIVFVGTTALGTREVVATPLDTLFAGVEVQATVADNLLEGKFFWRPEHGVTLETQVLLGIGLLAVLLVGRFGLAWGAGFIGVSVTAMWIASWYVLSRTGAYFSPLFPTAGLFSAFASMILAAFATERRRADLAGREKTTSQRLMVQALLSLTEVRDAETGRHSRRTRRYARALASQLATHPDFRDFLTPERIDLLSALAPLHDIGKVGVPDELLHKRGALTADELAEMRRHPAYGRDVILKAERDVGVHDDMTLGMAKDIVYTHHEKWDGTGYPEGLRGKQIPVAGRLMAVVDVYDAITSEREYHAAMSRSDAIAFIAGGRGTHFDPAVVDAFVAIAPHLDDDQDAVSSPPSYPSSRSGDPKSVRASA